MAKTKSIGEEAIKKLLTINISVPRNHPDYMPEYMRLNRKTEKLDPLIKNSLERDAEQLLKRLNNTLKKV